MFKSLHQWYILWSTIWYVEDLGYFPQNVVICPLFLAYDTAEKMTCANQHFKKYLTFVTVVSGSQQNWEEGTGISHLTLVPANA